MSESIRRILAATDFSPSSLVAVGRASLLAQGRGAALELFHVLPSPAGGAHGQRVRGERRGSDRLRRDTERRLTRTAETLSARARISVTARLVDGDPPEQIARRSQEGLELVVLGECAAHEVAPSLSRSTPWQVVERSPCPVLVAKRGAGRLPYGRVLLPVDITPEHVAAAALARAWIGESEVHLLHLRTTLPGVAGGDGAAGPHERLANFAHAARLPSQSARFHVHPLGGVGAILELAERVDADLTVLSVGASGDADGLRRVALALDRDVLLIRMTEPAPLHTH